MTHEFTIAVERLRTARDRLQRMMFVDRTIEDPFERYVAQKSLDTTYALLRKQGVTIPELEQQAETVWTTVRAYTPRQETSHA